MYLSLLAYSNNNSYNANPNQPNYNSIASSCVVNHRQKQQIRNYDDVGRPESGSTGVAHNAFRGHHTCIGNSARIIINTGATQNANFAKATGLKERRINSEMF